MFLQWVRPPDAIVGTVGTSTTQNAVWQPFLVYPHVSYFYQVQLNSGSITVNLGIDLTYADHAFCLIHFMTGITVLSTQITFPCLSSP